MIDFLTVFLGAATGTCTGMFLFMLLKWLFNSGWILLKEWSARTDKKKI